MTSKLSSLQALRGFAALVVVFFHAAALSNDYIGGVMYSPWMLVGKSGVDLFFVISGFVMVYTTFCRFDSPSMPSYFVVARFSRIYPSYWALTFVVYLYWLYNPSGVNAKHGGADPLSSFLLLPSPLLPLIPVAWTLVFEVFFYFVFLLLLVFVPRAHLSKALLLWALVCALNTVLSWQAPAYFLDSLWFSLFNLEFVGGAFLAMTWMRGGVKRWGWASAVAGVLWFAFIAAYFGLSHHAETFPIHSRIVMFLVPSVLMLYGCLALERQGFKVPVLWVKLGDWSYATYLTHILFIHLSYRIASRKFSVEWTPGTCWLFFIVLVVGSLAIGQLYHRWVERPLADWVRARLLGLLSHGTALDGRRS